MEFSGFGPGTTTFLADIATRQDRAWFAENRARYEREVLDKERAFVDAVGTAFASVDGRVQAVPAVDRSIFRIFRDVRFSRDKSPYKTHADMRFWVGDDFKRGPSYYVRIVADGVVVGGGAHQLQPDQITRLRSAIVASASGEGLERILGELGSAGYEVGEATLARVPSGFSADSPRAELLRYTMVHALRRVSPEPPEFASAAFVGWCMEQFVAVKPLVDWLAETIG